MSELYLKKMKWKKEKTGSKVSIKNLCGKSGRVSLDRVQKLTVQVIPRNG